MAVFFTSTYAQVVLALMINTMVASSDTFSDLMVVLFLYNAEFREMAFVVGVCDIIPGIVIFCHHFRSKEWTESSFYVRGFFLLSLLLQPFSLLITNVMWLLNIQSTHYHHLAKLSGIIHGSFESPCQVLILLYLIGKGYLQIPWKESVVLSDTRGNSVRLGPIGAMRIID